jgi:hypothetical protein
VDNALKGFREGFSLLEEGRVVHGGDGKFPPSLYTGSWSYGFSIAPPLGRISFQLHSNLLFTASITRNGLSHFRFGWCLTVPVARYSTSDNEFRYGDTVNAVDHSMTQDLVPDEITKTRSYYQSHTKVSSIRTYSPLTRETQRLLKP